MKILQVTCILGAITVIAVCQPLVAKRLISAQPKASADKDVTGALPDPSQPEATATPAVAAPPAETATSAVAATSVVIAAPRVSPVPVVIPSVVFSPRDLAYADDERAAADAPEIKVATLDDPSFSARDYAVDAVPKQNLTYLAYYAYSELPPEKKPADMVLDALKDVPVGTPVEEIKRAADAFGLDCTFMKTVAKIESDFDPKQRTGSYIGLFQLSKHEFAKYGSGEITNPRDNAIAAAYKFVNEATLFELDTHMNPSPSDLYLIHQQGWQGASEHVSHPERIAWQSMCATDEGKEKGEHWCKRAIWGNTLPTIKRIWKSVDKMTSAAFVQMWRERVDSLYARYSAALSPK
ncbi:MAG: transglycosylase [Xanthobacteraceae bacterium]